MDKEFAEQAYDAMCQEIVAAVAELVSAGEETDRESIRRVLIKYSLNHDVAVDLAISLLEE